ncbi:hypothetical protein [Couchioplanes caeruleus]|uniref:Secreted protein n=2 Tax=Couchioplanes caeruleus TaxID=56438 RepID=A0A1K0GQV6_9ACTN|nr:hypothetical protein [Couchioplanes caeruleus]OJF11635.1 hypothetical protein BG844_25165 [Couchioplanes caeruleus subsp. caeruleus]ROP31619.1 hypothetical protein EDD30_4540 [Couchioplanes caeruleus]
MVKKLVVVWAAMAAVLFGSATAAHAGSDSAWAYTTDASPGGKARFISNGDKIQACDNQEDGYYAWGYMYDLFETYLEAVREETTGDCDSDSHDVPEWETILVRACLGNSDASVRKFCTPWSKATVGTA